MMKNLNELISSKDYQFNSPNFKGFDELVKELAAMVSLLECYVELYNLNLDHFGDEEDDYVEGTLNELEFMALKKTYEVERIKDVRSEISGIGSYIDNKLGLIQETIDNIAKVH